MKIVDIKTLKGANYYSYHPVLRIEIDLGRFAGVESSELPGFNQKLLDSFPTLKEHYCSLGRPGGFVIRLREGTYLGHVIEHLILEMQNLLGYEVFYGCTRRLDKNGVYVIAVEYKNEKVASFLAQKAVEIVRNLALNKGNPPINDILREARGLKALTEPGPSTSAILEEARKLDIPVIPLSEEDCFYQLGYGKYQERIQATITSKTCCIAVDVACDKWRTKKLLEQLELPVPKGRIVKTREEVFRAVEELGTPVVIKPYNANQGKGVTSGLKKKEELIRAFKIAREYSKEVIVENSLSGFDYRLLVVGDRVVASSRRIPPFIIGDGRSSIRELIRKENESPVRGEGHEKPLTKIRVDQVVLLELYRQGLKLDDVLPESKKVYLRQNGNLSTGGLPIDVTDHVHPENKRLAVKAAKILGLDLAGVDIISPDISIPLTENNGGIIEVNAAPGIRMHHYPYKGKKRNVARKIVEYMFPTNKPARIPIVAVTGTNGKTTVTRILHRLLTETGFKVGMCCTGGIFIGDEKVAEGDTTGFYSCQRILKDPEVEAAVLETARGGLLKNGLGFDYCDVGIVTNIQGDHLGQGEIKNIEDLAHLKSLLIERTKKDGYAVLNAEDRFAGQFMKRARGQVILCSKNPSNILVWKHVNDGNKAVIVEEGQLKVLNGHNVKPLLSLKDIPLTDSGRIEHNVENVVLAVGGAIALNIPEKVLINGLKQFGNRLLDNPGRFTRLEITGRNVIIDYGHNSDGVARVLKTVRSYEEGQLWGIICSPGDRRNEDIIEIGRQGAIYLDHIIIKEDEDPRGRKRGEVALLLKEGIQKQGFSGLIKVIYDEKEAVLFALKKLRPGDTLVIFYEKDFEGLYDMISNFNDFEENQKENKPLLATRLT